MATIDEMLGIDPDPELTYKAELLLDSDEELLASLVGKRIERGLTQHELGKRIGVTQATISDFERAGGDPRLSTIRRYALAVDTHIFHFISDFKPIGKGKVSAVIPAARPHTGLPADQVTWTPAGKRLRAVRVNG